MKWVARGCFFTAVLLCLNGSAVAQTWTQTGAPETNWVSVASSADGSRLIAATCCYGLVYLSTNSGATWMAANMPYTNYSEVASSAEGRKLIAINMTGSFFVSTNYGESWTEGRMPEGSAWTGYSLAMSADGNIWATGNVIRNDLKQEWTVHTNLALINVVCSADGSKLIGRDADHLFTSTDSGVTWTKVDGAPFLGYLGCSADGNKLVGAYGFVYTSPDFGATWTQTTASNCWWQSVASSADGTKLTIMRVGSGDNEPIYTSADSGITWIPNTTPGKPWGVSGASWRPIASSADGNKLVAAVYERGIFTLRTTPSPKLNAATTTINLVLSWIVPSMPFTLEESPDMTPTSWTDVKDPAKLNYTNLCYEVTVPAPIGSRFYRLAQKNR